jgi:hypothetical protein
MYNKITMKFGIEYIVVIALFFILISTLTTWAASSNYRPYSSDTLFPKQYPYEGFRSMLEYTTYPNNGSIDSFNKNNISQASMPNYEKVKAFGLVSSTSAVEMPLNDFGNDKGSPACEQSIYSNSGGFLCLTSEQKKLLKTRGGNASGCSNQQIVK